MTTRQALRTDPRSDATRRALVAAAVDVLRHEGFAKATARHVAQRAGCNQGLVFYHFGSVSGLLLAAMDEVSAERRSRFETAMADVHTPSELLELASRIFEEDIDSGDAALLVEMIAGTASTPGLGAEVKARVEPWTAFATVALGTTFGGSALLGALDPEDLAYAVISMYLGLELLSHLDGDRTRARNVFTAARGLSSFADLLVGTARTTTTTPPVTKEQP